MEITAAEIKLIMRLRQMQEHEEMSIKLGSKYGQRAFVVKVTQQEVFSNLPIPVIVEHSDNV